MCPSPRAWRSTPGRRRSKKRERERDWGVSSCFFFCCPPFEMCEGGCLRFLIVKQGHKPWRLCPQSVSRLGWWRAAKKWEGVGGAAADGEGARDRPPPTSLFFFCVQARGRRGELAARCHRRRRRRQAEGSLFFLPGRCVYVCVRACVCRDRSRPSVTLSPPFSPRRAAAGNGREGAASPFLFSLTPRPGKGSPFLFFACVRRGPPNQCGWAPPR